MWPPEDVYSELVRLRPSIDVDEHGGMSISVDSRTFH